MLNNQLRQDIKKYAEQLYPNECCGLLVDISGSLNFCPCKNISSNPTKHFELSCLDYVRWANSGVIVGMVHSQNAVLPSTLDIINYKSHKLPSYIYSFKSNEIFKVTDKHSKYNKYLGREFKMGANDCFTLVRDFYLQERNISIFNYLRNDHTHKEFPNIIEDNYKKENFIKIEFNNIIEGDLIEFSFFHFGIYLEGDLLLHHHRNKYSNIELLNDIWKKRISNIYRHE